jgi:hypothetical protein
MLKLRDCRPLILERLTKALDNCIKAAEERGDPEPKHFEATIEVRFDGSDDYIAVKPAIDFSKPLPPQFKDTATVVEPEET